MNILVFGSTGSVGRHLVEQALALGYEVTAFTRDPGKIGRWHSRLRVMRGEVLDPASVEGAMPDQEAVLCAIGAGRQGKVRAEGTRNIVRAMVRTGVRRLICQSTLGVGESRGNLDFFWKHAMFGFLLRAAYADHVAQEDHVVESGLDWTIVRPGAFTDGPLTAEYRHGFSGGDRTTRLKVSRADVAHFMLRQLTDPTYLRAAPGLSY